MFYKCNSCGKAFDKSKFYKKAVGESYGTTIYNKVWTCPTCSSEDIRDLGVEEFNEIVESSYDKWLSKARNEATCIYAIHDGGPGWKGFGKCMLEAKHSNVRYGCEHCPENCEDYRESSRKDLISRLRGHFISEFDIMYDNFYEGSENNE